MAIRVANKANRVEAEKTSPYNQRVKDRTAEFNETGQLKGDFKNKGDVKSNNKTLLGQEFGTRNKQRTDIRIALGAKL